MTTSAPSDVIYNWSGIHPLAKTSQLCYPPTVAHVQQLLQSLAKESNPKIRIIGSGLSYEPIVQVSTPASPDTISAALTSSSDSNAATSGPLLISLKELSGLVGMGGSTATFLAGTTLDEVFSILVAHNRQLPCSPGVIGIQTVAGATATGTHGQGLYQSSIADTIHSMDVVHPDGSLVTITDSNPNFGAYMSGLGCLGIAVSFTFNTQPMQTLTCMKSSIPYEDFVEHYVTLNRENEYVKTWWFPETDLVHVWCASESTTDQKAAYDANDRKLLAISAADDAMNRTVDSIAAKMAEDTKDDSRSGRQFDTVARFYNATAVTGNIFQIFCKGIPVPQINCEIAVPLVNFKKAVAALKDWVAVHGHHRLHYPFIFRSTGASRAWLSPSYGQEVCYIGFLVYLAKDGTAAPGSFDMMRSIQQVLAPLGGIPHLGKHFARDVFDFEAALPRWKDFDALRKSVDPKGMLENDFVASLFAGEFSSTKSKRATASRRLERPAIAARL
ncbi:FAD binding domain-containing protein [Zopfochytrium polystomum]|nr:FAD binding domain-containing protein [Zopfochytrium polystomum]